MAQGVVAAPQFAPNQLFIQLPSNLINGSKPGPNFLSTRGARILADAVPGAKIVKTYRHINWELVQLPPSEPLAAAFASFGQVLGAEKVALNYKRYAAIIPNDPDFTSEQWNMNIIQAPTAWNVTTGSHNVVVGVVDSGINQSHPDLAANLWSNPFANPNDGYGGTDIHGINAITGTGDPEDDYGHGTHCSGVIGAVGNNGIGVAGVNWNVQIMALKFLDATGTGTDSDAITCIDYAISMKQQGVNLVALSNSWGGTGTDPALKSAFDAAAQAGILCPCAAGNSGADNDTNPFSPASLGSDSIIAVAASDSNDNPAQFSNYGPTTVALAAPGVNITSTYLSGGYEVESGTSMATPHVAGAAALIAAQYPGLTMDQIKQRILSSVDIIPAWAGLTITGGRLNLAKALAAPPKPSLAPIPNQKVVVPGSTGPIPIMVSGIGSTAISVSASSGNTTVVPSTGISIGGTSIAPTIAVTPSAAGTATITVGVVDTAAQFTASTTFTVTALSPPSIRAPANQTISFPGSTGALAVTVGGAGGDQVTVTAASENLTIVPASGVVVGGTVTFPTVTVTPAAAGTAQIELTATDASTGLSSSASFTVTATAQSPPQIVGPPNQTVVLPNSTGVLPISVSAGTGGVPVISARSSNLTVVPASGIVLGGTATLPTIAVAPAAVGISTITLTVSEPNSNATASATFTVTAEALPVITAPPNEDVVLPGNTGALAVKVGGGDGGPLTLTATSGNLTVVPASGIVIGGTLSLPTITVTPAVAGTAVISLELTDPTSGLSASASFSVVASTQPLPTITAPANQTVVIPGNTGALKVTIGGINSDNFTFTATSGNTAVVPSTGIVIGGTVTVPTVTVTPVEAGTAVITLTVTENGNGLTASSTFTVTAEALPTISGPQNITVSLPGSTGPLPVQVGGAGGDALTLSATSGNLTVVPASGLVIGGTVSEPTIDITPAAAGTAVITLDVSDPATGLSASANFSVLAEAESAPAITAPANQTVVLPGNTGALPVSVGGANGDKLSLSASSGNTSVVPNADIQIGGTVTLPTLTVTPAAAGSSVITLTATDTVTGLNASATFTVTAEALPTIIPPASQTVVLPGNTGALFVIVGGAGGDPLALTASSGNLTIVPASGVVVGGTGFAPTVTVTPAAQGTAIITLKVTDTVTGLTAAATFTVAAASLPTIVAPANQSVALPENTGALPVTVGGAGGDPLTLTASSSNLTVVPSSGLVVGGTHSLPTITVTPAAAGTAVITLTVSDAKTGLSASATFTVSVSAEVTPSVTAPPNLTVILPGSTGALAVKISGATGDALVLTATSNNLTVVPATGIVIGGTSVAPTITVTPAVAGSASITLKLTDTVNGLTASATFTVSSAILPVISVPANQTVVLPGSTGALTVTVSGTGGDAWTLTATSSNLTVVPSADVVVGGTAAIPTVEITPAVAGTSTITLQVVDLSTGLKSTGSFTVTAGFGLSIGNSTVTAGTTGTEPATLTVSLSQAQSSLPVTVHYATSDGTAKAGTNYTATSGTLTIPAGSTSANITVQVLGTTTGVSGLTFGVVLSDPVNAVIAEGSGTCTIAYPNRPEVVGLSPQALTSPINAAAALTATYADTGGYAKLTRVQLCVGTNGAPSTSLYAEYLPATNLLYLFNANNVAIGGFAPGSNNVISSGLGALNCAKTTVTGSGNNLTVAWSISPGTGLVGKHYVYLQASDALTTTSWTILGSWTVSAPGPSLAGLTPTALSSSAGTAELLTSTYVDGGGYAALTKVQICVGANGSPATSLYAEYLPSTGLLYLFNASNAAVGGFAPGSSNIITTPLGSLNCAKTTVSGSGNDLTVAWSITPTTALDGKQYTYLQASDAAASTSWTAFGTWSITSPGPSVLGLTPTAISSSAGTAESLTSVYGDGGGYAALTKVQLCAGANGLPSTSLYAEYLPATNLLYLFNGSNVAIGGFAPGSSNVISTTLGALNCAKTTVSGTGDNLTVTWNITPSIALEGKQSTYLQASDASAATNWTEFGTWAIGGPAPSVVSLTPASLTSSAGTAELFTATYADGSGYSALTQVQFCVGANGAPSTTLYAEYLPATNLLYLFDASNVAVGGFAPGSSNVITTNLGSLNCAQTQVTGSGNNLTVVWDIMPAAALAGDQRTFLQAADANSATNWTSLGTWVISANETTSASEARSPARPSENSS